MIAASTSRRGFLGGALALPAGLALGGPVEASALGAPESPIKAIARRYLAAVECMRDARSQLCVFDQGRLSFPEEERIMDEATRAIAAEPITSMEDLALVLWVVGSLPGAEWQLRTKCRDFLAQEMDQ